ncbi:complement component C9 isoform X1 [Fundulus heteroclitus]|uniref:complement component C9 isoform X1 n=1 Tax=Fundulus heteroclitus TaxID=8078 RepID=UPI00165C6C8E|nr:complement component C9 isoform X1 [Fundulus heteroclitus]
MRLAIALQLSLSALCSTLAFFDGGLGAVLPEPAAVNCQWSRWSEWSSCDPCTKSRRRSRGIEAFGQFDGESCMESIGDRQACQPSESCLTPTPYPCKQSEFRCTTELQTCIRKRLECNGDYDCEDGSDEDCEPTRTPCGASVFENNEQGRTAGYGINILGADPRRNPFNNDYFNGRCDRARNPYTGKYDRLPWNVGVLQYETLVEETASKEIYEDTYSIVKEMLKETTFKVDAGFSFKFTATEPSLANTTIGAEAGAEFSKKNVLKEVTEYSVIKNKSFMRVKGRVQLSTYRMRSRELNVAEEFLIHVRSLPVVYEKGIYFAFLEDYGTHYTKIGKSGGEYELIYILNQDAIKAKNMTQRGVQTCVKAGISADFGFPTGGSATAHVRPEYCDNPTNTQTATAEGKALVDKVMTSVKGGTLETAVTMRAQLNREGVMNIDAYRNWARSIADVPALINSEAEPIYNLIPLDTPDANNRISNLKRAIEEYVAEYNICKCKPCQNGGTLALIDGKCICMCTGQFEGLACQNYRADKAANQAGQRPTVLQEGNWSCWGPWSPCSGGKHSRTRHCRTDGLSETVKCRGEATSEEYC